MKKVFCDASNELITAAFCVFIGSAGIVMNSNVVAMDPRVAGEQMTPDGTQLWADAVFRRNKDGSEIWIEGKDLGDPSSKTKNDRLKFTIRLRKLTVRDVQYLANDFKKIKQKIGTKTIAAEYLAYLDVQLGDDFCNVINSLKDGKTNGYAIMKDGAAVGFIYDNIEGNSAKAYVSMYKGEGGCATQAYITYVRGLNRSYSGEIALGNITSLKALASAINRGGLRCRLLKKNGTAVQPEKILDAQTIRSLADADGKIRNVTDSDLKGILEKNHQVELDENKGMEYFYSAEQLKKLMSERLSMIKFELSPN